MVHPFRQAGRRRVGRTNFEGLELFALEDRVDEGFRTSDVRRIEANLRPHTPRVIGWPPQVRWVPFEYLDHLHERSLERLFVEEVIAIASVNLRPILRFDGDRTWRRRRRQVARGYEPTP